MGMDSTSFKGFMHAQVQEMQRYITAHGGDPDHSLAIKWAETLSEGFRGEWDRSCASPRTSHGVRLNLYSDSSIS